jgi:hypothetical protein
MALTLHNSPTPFTTHHLHNDSSSPLHKSQSQFWGRLCPARLERERVVVSPTNSVDGIKGFHGTFPPNGSLSPHPQPFPLGIGRGGGGGVGLEGEGENGHMYVHSCTRIRPLCTRAASWHTNCCSSINNVLENCIHFIVEYWGWGRGVLFTYTTVILPLRFLFLVSPLSFDV